MFMKIYFAMGSGYLLVKNKRVMKNFIFPNIYCAYKTLCTISAFTRKRFL